MLCRLNLETTSRCRPPTLRRAVRCLERSEDRTGRGAQGLALLLSFFSARLGRGDASAFEEHVAKHRAVTTSGVRVRELVGTVSRPPGTQAGGRPPRWSPGSAGPFRREVASCESQREGPIQATSGVPGRHAGAPRELSCSATAQALGDEPT